MLNIKELILNKHFLTTFIGLIFIILLINVRVNISEFVFYSDVFLYLKKIAIHLGLYDVGLALVKPFLLFSQTFIYLSSTANINISLELFIASVTIFILFFSFAQFSLSNSTIPNHLIKKYIINDYQTYSFIGYHVGIAVILVYFTLVGKQITNMNNLIGILLIFSSFLYSILYFFWMIKRGTPVGLLQIIIGKLNISEILTIEEKALKKRKAFDEQLIKSNFKLKFFTNNIFGFIIEEFSPLYSEKRGIVSDIDLKGINNLLLPYKEYIREVIIDVQIGDYLPKYEPYPGLTPRSIFLRIHKNIKNITIDGKYKAVNAGFAQAKIYQQLENCFIIEPRSEIQTRNIEVIRDIFILFMNTIENDNPEADDLMDVLVGFLYTEFLKEKEKKWISEIGLSQNLFINFIEFIGKYLSKKELTAGKIEAIYLLLINLSRLAAKYQSRRLMNKILDVTSSLFESIIIDSDKFNKRIAAMIQAFKEIGIYSIFYAYPAADKKSFCKNWDTFYQGIIVDTFNYSITSFKYLIIHYDKRTERDIIFIIANNMNDLNDFYSPLVYNTFIEEYYLSNSKGSKNKRYKFLKYSLNKVLQLCIYVYNNVKKNTIPVWMIEKISLKLMDEFISPSWGLSEKTDILNDLYYNPDWDWPDLLTYSNEFNLYSEQNDHESYFGFNVQDEFWIIYSLHCCRLNRDIIPNKLSGKSNNEIDSNKKRLEGFKKNISEYDKKLAMDLLKISAEQYNEYIEDITNKLEKLLA